MTTHGTSGLLANRGELLQRAGRFAEAGPILRQASERIRVVAPGTPEGPLIDAQLAAQVMNSGGDMAAARALLERAAGELRALGVADQRLAGVLNDYGVALAGENRWPEAIAAHREAVELAERALGTDHMITIDVRAGLAGVLGMAGQFRECAQRHREVLQSRRKVLGERNLDTLWSSVSLSDCLLSAGDAAEAVGLSRDALAGLLALNGADHPVSQFAQATAARAACVAGDHAGGLANPWRPSSTYRHLRRDPLACGKHCSLGRALGETMNGAVCGRVSRCWRRPRRRNRRAARVSCGRRKRSSTWRICTPGLGSTERRGALVRAGVRPARHRSETARPVSPAASRRLRS
ncbi:MAG: tetratricopeptide repeat protein [Steroidobacteraceae bacterium]